MNTDSEFVDVVNRRADLLAALAAPREKRELVAELGLSRSTVDRALRELESMGLVTRWDGYRLTIPGRLVAELYAEFTDALADVLPATDLLSVLPPDAPLDYAMLDDGTVEPAEPPAWTKPLDGVLTLIGRADRMRVMFPTISRSEFVEAYYEATVDGGLPLDMVVTPELADYLGTAHDERIREMLARDHFGLFVTEHVPYGLGVGRSPDGASTALAVYGSGGEFRGLVRNEGLEAYVWAHEVVTEFRDAADQATPEAF